MLARHQLADRVLLVMMGLRASEAGAGQVCWNPVQMVVHPGLEIPVSAHMRVNSAMAKHSDCCLSQHRDECRMRSAGQADLQAEVTKHLISCQPELPRLATACTTIAGLLPRCHQQQQEACELFMCADRHEAHLCMLHALSAVGHCELCPRPRPLSCHAADLSHWLSDHYRVPPVQEDLAGHCPGAAAVAAVAAADWLLQAWHLI